MTSGCRRATRAFSERKTVVIPARLPNNISEKESPAMMECLNFNPGNCLRALRAIPIPGFRKMECADSRCGLKKTASILPPSLRTDSVIFLCIALTSASVINPFPTPCWLLTTMMWPNTSENFLSASVTPGRNSKELQSFTYPSTIRRLMTPSRSRNNVQLPSIIKLCKLMLCHVKVFRNSDVAKVA